MCCARLAENTARKKSPKSRHLGIIPQLCRAMSSQLRHVSTIGKNVKQQYLLQMSPQYGELRPTSGWDRFVSFGHPCKFQRVSRLGSVTARHSSSGRQPNFAALNRGRHLYSAGRPSRWALAHISSVLLCFSCRLSRYIFYKGHGGKYDWLVGVLCKVRVNVVTNFYAIITGSTVCSKQPTNLSNDTVVFCSKVI